jgi:hypothetical protein
MYCRRGRLYQLLFYLNAIRARYILKKIYETMIDNFRADLRASLAESPNIPYNVFWY